MRMLRAKSAVCLIVSPARVAGIRFFFVLIFAFLCTQTCGGEEVARSLVLLIHDAVRSLQGGRRGGGRGGMAGMGCSLDGTVEAIKTVG